MLAYLASRPSTWDHSFFASAETLSWEHLVRALREAIHAAGLNTTQFSGHSFRIGAATVAVAAGLSDPLIQVLGQWKVAAFQSYIRTHVEKFVMILAILATTPARRSQS